eukprot:TRINITY_DN35537_c0_g1_i2.p1 TRINITY_DN35537_c0_g1~~TRINITY_DN35537_c0_g1_i2.p1  ORF type:complete len:744 (+),score=27.62 TRINITY_DN35537_c0_g1_i2:34-2265(+)
MYCQVRQGYLRGFECIDKGINNQSGSVEILATVFQNGPSEDILSYILCPQEWSWQSSFFIKSVGSAYQSLGLGKFRPPFPSKISVQGGGVVTYQQLPIQQHQQQQQTGRILLSGWMAGLRQSLEQLQRHLLFQDQLCQHDSLEEREETIIVYVVPPDDSTEAIIKSIVIASQLLAPCMHGSQADIRDTASPGYSKKLREQKSQQQGQDEADPSTPQSDPQNCKNNKIQSPSIQSSPAQKETSLLDIKQQLNTYKIRIFCMSRQQLGLESSPNCHEQIALESYRYARNEIAADCKQATMFESVTNELLNVLSLNECSQLSFQDSNSFKRKNIKLMSATQSVEVQVQSQHPYVSLGGCTMGQRQKNDKPQSKGFDSRQGLKDEPGKGKGANCSVDAYGQQQLRGLHCCYTISRHRHEALFQHNLRAVIVNSEGSYIRSGQRYLSGDCRKSRRVLQQALLWVIGFCFQDQKCLEGIHFISFQKLGLVSSEEESIFQRLVQGVVCSMLDMQPSMFVPEMLEYVFLHSLILQRQQTQYKNKQWRIIPCHAGNTSDDVIQWYSCSVSESIINLYFCQFKRQLLQLYESININSVQGYCMVRQAVVKLSDFIQLRQAGELFSQGNGKCFPFILKDAQSPADAFSPSDCFDSVGSYNSINVKNEESKQQCQQHYRSQKIVDEQDVTQRVYEDLINMTTVTQVSRDGYIYGTAENGDRRIFLPLHCMLLIQLGGLCRLIDENCVDKLKRSVE